MVSTRSLLTWVLVSSMCVLASLAQTNIAENQRSGPECTLPMNPGACNLNITRFYFDVATKNCRPFIFKGCGGNLNNYPTEMDCNMRCICSRPAKTGNGAETLPRFYYNMASGKCEEYLFSGMGGNSNKFRTAEQCAKTCIVSQNSGLRRCDRRPDFGRNCGNSTIRFYYDKHCDCCREFTYLGCDGNGNRFESEAVCKSKCAAGDQPTTTTVLPTPNPNTRPSMCYGAPTRGPCSQNVARYYFDASGGECRSFTYSGCGGNGNNFMVPTDCVSICKASSLATTTTTTTTEQPMPPQCNLPLRRGNCPRIMLRFYYNKSTRSCRMFLFSGCGGNANNFLTFMDCIGTCNARVL